GRPALLGRHRRYPAPAAGGNHAARVMSEYSLMQPRPPDGRQLARGRAEVQPGIRVDAQVTQGPVDLGVPVRRQAQPSSGRLDHLRIAGELRLDRAGPAFGVRLEPEGTQRVDRVVNGRPLRAVQAVEALPQRVE